MSAALREVPRVRAAKLQHLDQGKGGGGGADVWGRANSHNGDYLICVMQLDNTNSHSMGAN